ncbi:hypothetical protein QAD02_011709 [Eretmocerus hayati]|uniref:Uncharacterized protein n=1 Tax=Eretmocerus hayati TaxID=131215 RepID=A0ACC2NXH6_9HYME|nr:hypothetical protein QAD02_011709 [Eretmocerus hayati]
MFQFWFEDMMEMGKVLEENYASQPQNFLNEVDDESLEENCDGRETFEDNEDDDDGEDDEDNGNSEADEDAEDEEIEENEDDEESNEDEDDDESNKDDEADETHEDVDKNGSGNKKGGKSEKIAAKSIPSVNTCGTESSKQNMRMMKQPIKIERDEDAAKLDKLNKSREKLRRERMHPYRKPKVPAKNASPNGGAVTHPKSVSNPAQPLLDIHTFVKRQGSEAPCLRPCILKSIINRISVESAEKFLSCDEFRVSAEAQALAKKLLILNFC